MSGKPTAANFTQAINTSRRRKSKIKEIARSGRNAQKIGSIYFSNEPPHTKESKPVSI